MKTVKLKPNVSLIEVSRRFHESEATIIKASYYRGSRPRFEKLDEFADDFKERKKIYDHAYWIVLYNGDDPNLSGLKQ